MSGLILPFSVLTLFLLCKQPNRGLHNFYLVNTYNYNVLRID